MKKILCFVVSEKLDELEEALWKVGVSGLTVTGIRRLGNPSVRSPSEFLPRLKLEILIKDEQLDDVIRTIRQVDQTGEREGAKMAVLPAKDLYRIHKGGRPNTKR